MAAILRGPGRPPITRPIPDNYLYEHPPQGFCEHPLLSPRGVLYIAAPDQQNLPREGYIRHPGREFD